jgi:hypothetical protein
MPLTTRVNRNNFDSKLEFPNARGVANAILRVEIRLLMARVDGNSFTRGGRTYRTRSWTGAEWRNFLWHYKHIVEHYWNNRFWLQPADNFSGIDLPLARPTHRPNVACQLQVIYVANATERRHARIRVVHMADGEPTMRSNAITLDNRDVETRYIQVARLERTYIQIPAVHEMAHLLGIHHPGRAYGYGECRTNMNRDICYGRTGPHRDELSGSGMAFSSDRYADPWRRRIDDHTGIPSGNWTLLRSAEPPRPLAMINVTRRAGERMRERLIQSVDGL